MIPLPHYYVARDPDHPLRIYRFRKGVIIGTVPSPPPLDHTQEGLARYF